MDVMPSRSPDPSTIPLHELNVRRQDFLRAFDAWLQLASLCDARDETTSTVNAVKAMFQLRFG